MTTPDTTTETQVEAMMLTKTVLTGSHIQSSRLIGVLFLSAFVLYGAGNALVTAALGAPDARSTISAHQSTLVLGALLMLLNSAAVVGIAVLFFPILENRGKRIALAYLASRIVEAVLLAVGVLCLLMILPLAQHAVDAGEASAAWAKALGSLAFQSNTMAYQIAAMSLGIGSIFLCSLLFRIRLIPRFLAGWGVIGYAMFLAGAIAEILGIHIGLMLSIPGGLFELVFGFWLLLKGLQIEAYRSQPAIGSPA